MAESLGFLTGECSELLNPLCLPLSPADPADRSGCEEGVLLCGVLCLDLLCGRPEFERLDCDNAGLVCDWVAVLVTVVSRFGRIEALVEEREFE